MSSEDFSDDDEYYCSWFDRKLLKGICDADEAAVQHALQSGANVNAVGYLDDEDDTTPLMEACSRGLDEFVRILLDAGANARWKDSGGGSAVLTACAGGHLSIVQQLINRDRTLLKIADYSGATPLTVAVSKGNLHVVQFLMERGANIATTTAEGATTVMTACFRQGNIDVVRLLLAAGVDVEARDGMGQTALHYAVNGNNIDAVRELILLHNANMFAANKNGHTPFDSALGAWYRNRTVNPLLEIYAIKLEVDHGWLALHAVLGAAEYSFAEYFGFHPPRNPLRIVLPLGKLQVKHWRTMLHNFDDPERTIRSRDDSGMLPIHIACRNTAPVEILALILELDPTSLRIADNTGALPLHKCCGGMVEFSSVRFLVEQGGVGTLAARNREGALPLHHLCGSTNPPLLAVQYLIQSYPRSVSMRTNAGQFPFMIAACASSAASLSVVYELVRANPSLVVPR